MVGDGPAQQDNTFTPPVVIATPAPGTSSSRKSPSEIPFGTLPDTITVGAPYAPPGAFEGQYELQDNFAVDQDTFNNWQAAAIASNGEHLFIAAVDNSPSKGTLLKMNVEGKDWEDLGDSFLSRVSLGATGYVMKHTLGSLAVNVSGTALISDATEGLYSYEKEVRPLKLSPGARQIVFAHDRYILLTPRGLEQLQVSSSTEAPTPFESELPPGELPKVMGKSPEGELFVATGTQIFRLEASGEATALVSLEDPALRALSADAEGNLFGLYADRILWWKPTGESKTLAEGDLISPVGLVWAGGSLYVADAGTSSKTSVILQFR